MRKAFLIFLLTVLATLAIPLPTQAAFGETSLDLGLSSQNNDIPNDVVIAILKSRFDRAKPPLAIGDLRMGSRWNCREFFARPTGHTSFRFRAFQFRHYEGAILEDELNNSPRFYVFGRNELKGTSAALPGVVSEVRLDYQGNLRIAEVESATGLARSFVVCHRMNLQTGK